MLTSIFVANIHEKVAEGIGILGNIIDKPYVIIPVGLEGAVLCHLLDVDREKRNQRYLQGLENTVDISSKRDNNDFTKFEEILKCRSYCKPDIYALDMRTKTGKLGRMLRERAENFKKDRVYEPFINFYYIVLFDPSKKADIRAFKEDLSDQDRIQLMTPEEYGKLVSVGIENISHEFIESLPSVQQITELIRKLP